MSLVNNPRLLLTLYQHICIVSNEKKKRVKKKGGERRKLHYTLRVNQEYSQDICF